MNKTKIIIIIYVFGFFCTLIACSGAGYSKAEESPETRQIDFRGCIGTALMWPLFVGTTLLTIVVEHSGSDFTEKKSK